MINQARLLAAYDTANLTSRAVSRSENPDNPSMAMPRCNTRLHAPGLASRCRTLRDADNIVGTIKVFHSVCLDVHCNTTLRSLVPPVYIFTN